MDETNEGTYSVWKLAAFISVATLGGWFCEIVQEVRVDVFSSLSPYMHDSTS